LLSTEDFNILSGNHFLLYILMDTFKEQTYDILLELEELLNLSEK